MKSYQNARKNSDKQNAKIEHDKALKRVITAVLKDDAELYKQFSDNPEFRRWMTDDFLNDVRKRSSNLPRGGQVPAPHKTPFNVIANAVCYRGRMNDVYIDIDGPLIREGKPTAHCFGFLRWAVEVHRPHWLTTRDAHGQHDGILRAFRHAMGSPELPSEIEALLRAVRPTRWSLSEVSGIDLASDFVWVDDAPLAVEIEALRGRGIIVNSDDALLRAVDVILPAKTHLIGRQAAEP